MKIVVSAEKLSAIGKTLRDVARDAEVLQHSSGVVARATNDGTLRLDAGGRGSWARAEMKCDVLRPGAAILPPNIFCEVPSRCDGDIEIAADEKAYIVTCGSYRIQGPVLANAHEAVECPGISERIAVVSDGKELQRALRMALSVADNNSVRPHSYVRLTVEQDSVIVASTDGRRLVRYKVPATETVASLEHILVGRDDAMRLADLSLAGAAKLFSNGNMFAIRDCDAGVTLAASHGAGFYPRLESVINRQHTESARFTCDMSVLEEACRWLRAADCEYHMGLEVKDGVLTVTGRTKSGGEAAFEVAVKDCMGAGRVVIWQEIFAKFVSAAKGCGDVTVTIHGEQEVLKINQEGSWLYLQMPITVREER